MKLRSVELELPHPAEAHAFLTEIWKACDGGRAADAYFVRGAGSQPYLVGLYAATTPAIRGITFVTDKARIEKIQARCRDRDVRYSEIVSDDPGGGTGIEIYLPENECFRFLADAENAESIEAPSAPTQLTHVVFNSVDAESSARFCEDVLGFRVSDRTKGMVFVRCNESHHSIAFARAGFASLNHIAFEMPDLDSVMRGIGRMRDAGFAPSWGPGRHGPGDNVFAYYIAPFGAVVEFSTAVEIVGDDYRTGAPEDWTWPPGRIDQWGMSDKDIDHLLHAEKIFCFRTPAQQGQKS